MKSSEEIREIHDMEQIGAALRVIAAMVFTYYARLKDEGFTEEQAMELASLYQYHLLGTPELDEDDSI